MKILAIWFFEKYNGGNSFSLMFKLYSNMNLLEVNAWLWRKVERYSNLINLDYICEQFGDKIWFFHKTFLHWFCQNKQYWTHNSILLVQKIGNLFCTQTHSWCLAWSKASSWMQRDRNYILTMFPLFRFHSQEYVFFWKDL